MNTKTSLKSSNQQPVILALSLGVALALNASTTLAGVASNPKVVASSSTGDNAQHVDVFNVNSQPSIEVPRTQNSFFGDKSAQRTPITIWFQKFDEERIKHLPSSEDKVIIARPINQQAERLTQWAAAAERIAKTYTEFAKLLRKMSVPPGYADLKEYKDLTADWYQDTAQIFTDYVRPRPASRTIEELEEQIKETKSREKSLVKTKTRIVEMDADIRAKYKVNAIFPQDESKSKSAPKK
jgi:hypothetical protein